MKLILIEMCTLYYIQINFRTHRKKIFKNISSNYKLVNFSKILLLIKNNKHNRFKTKLHHYLCRSNDSRIGSQAQKDHW